MKHVGDVSHEGDAMCNHNHVLARVCRDDVVDGGAHSFDDARGGLLEVECAVLVELEVDLYKPLVLAHLVAAVDDVSGLDRPAQGARVKRCGANAFDPLSEACSLSAAEGAEWWIGAFGHALVAIAVAHEPDGRHVFYADQEGGFERSHGLGQTLRIPCHG